MKSYPIATFKAKLSQILSLVIRGHDIVITDHNKPVVRVTSINKLPKLPKTNPAILLKMPLVQLKASALSSSELVRKLRDE